MPLEKIKDAIEKVLDRKEVVRGRGEESTKQAMILPMLEALGYDIWNPSEVCPEVEADTTVRKGSQKEKVDYAIILGGVPRIFIEAKSLDESLDGHHGQLKRYFNTTTTVSLGILTNGIEYRFFTDTREQNIQDDEPFFTVNFESVDQGLDVLARFQKSVFSAEAIREFATELNYTSKMIKFLSHEIDIRDGDLSEEFVRWILGSKGMYEGRVTTNVVDRFKPIAKDSLQRVIRKIVRRTVAAIDMEVSSAQEGEASEEDCDETISLVENKEGEDAIIRKGENITDEELQAFAIVKEQFDNSALANATIYEPAARKDIDVEIGYRDTSTYFNIYFNKPSWWNLRLSLESKIKWIGVDVEEDVASALIPDSFVRLKPSAISKVRIQINSVEDIHALNRVIFASFEKTISDRDSFRIKDSS